MYGDHLSSSTNGQQFKFQNQLQFKTSNQIFNYYISMFDGLYLFHLFFILFWGGMRRGGLFLLNQHTYIYLLRSKTIRIAL